MSRGLAQADIDALPQAQYFEVASADAAAEEQCPICRRGRGRHSQRLLGSPSNTGWQCFSARLWPAPLLLLCVYSL